MSRTLNLADHLLEKGRNFQKLGRESDALHALDRVAGLRDVPPEVAEETQARLAEILLGRRQYLRARRHLTAALIQQPDNARYHYLMAGALKDDVRADAQRAAEHYRKSLELDSQQPHCLVEFGRLALQIGQTQEGLTCLRQAAALAPNDPDIIGQVATGLQEVECLEEARALLLAALFRNARDSRFRRLWNDFQFDQLREEQETNRREGDARLAGSTGPIFLPFVRPAPGASPSRLNGKRIRRDGPAPLPPPHIPGPARLPDRKHA